MRQPEGAEQEFAALHDVILDRNARTVTRAPPQPRPRSVKPKDSTAAPCRRSESRRAPTPAPDRRNWIKQQRNHQQPHTLEIRPNRSASGAIAQSMPTAPAAQSATGSPPAGVARTGATTRRRGPESAPAAIARSGWPVSRGRPWQRHHRGMASPSRDAARRSRSRDQPIIAVCIVSPMLPRRESSIRISMRIAIRSRNHAQPNQCRTDRERAHPVGTFERIEPALVFRQRRTVALRMPQMQHAGGEIAVLAAHAGAHEPDQQIGILQPPAAIGRVEAVDPVEIAAPDREIARARAAPGARAAACASGPSGNAEQRRQAVDAAACRRSASHVAKPTAPARSPARARAP